MNSGEMARRITELESELRTIEYWIYSPTFSGALELNRKYEDLKYTIDAILEHLGMESVAVDYHRELRKKDGG